MANVESKQFVDFTGGLNLVDSELNMNPNFMTVAQNVELGYDSTIKKRNGFKLIKNIMPYLFAGTESEAPETIKEIFYFATYLLIYTSKGRVLSLDDQNNVYIEWDEFEAAMIGTTIWNSVDQRCFGASAYDMFVLSNGYDKPLQVCFNNIQRITFEAKITGISGNTITFDKNIEGNFIVGVNVGLIKDDGTWLVSKLTAKTTNSITLESVSGFAVNDNVMMNQGTGAVVYLHDPATGSNANTPVIFKCVMVNHYLCAICLEREKVLEDLSVVWVPDTHVYISAKDQPGVWKTLSGEDEGAADAGACYIDISTLLRLDDQYLIDIDMVRGELCVFTNYAFILYRLDTYKDSEESVWDAEHSAFKTETTSEHIPELDTIVENAGCITTGSVRTTYDSTAFLSTNGINSVRRNVISQNFIPESLSYKVLPYIKERMTDNFIINGAVTMLDTRKFLYGLKFEDNTMLLMSFHPNLDKKNCFYTWTNIRYISFTNNVYGRILTTDGYGIMMYSDDSEGIAYDQYVNPYNGEVENETFEMIASSPWLMYGKANNLKTMEYINVVADKTAYFTVSSMFDLKDENEVTIDMLGGDREGYGAGYKSGESGTDPYYGGGIIASNLNLIDFNQSFMYNKFKIRSVDKYPLRVIRIGVHYKTGGIRR